ncbi:DUF1707 and DUF2154 domain-containing protein [Actinobacteria bacterium YIM 96077]|uniref:DUF1707 SHOCT-like domain-containing protein n=1 Tax=Phytoactinopolyspora halophila TaxID=1981511 RepID=UPI000F505927|nr:DUF1707 domain-containing protein [Phytoactinopolyspora halophila]AYY14346.1 DUF1707 and DUF2154 domain-containing protein [Actinobacteria bacterium YIM 96077]
MSETPSEREEPTPESEVPRVESPADLRCSDVDRERVAEALRQAAGEGRLTLTELEERLDAVYRARTYGDLQPITRDLPQGPYPIPGAAGPNVPGAAGPNWQGQPALHPRPADPVPRQPDGHQPADQVQKEQINAILSDEKRDGRWEVPRRLDVVPLIGSVELDFTDAIVRSPEVEIRVGAVLGSVTVIVPEGIDVRMDSITNILGERKMKLDRPVTQGAPVCRISGFIVLGEITVRPPKKRKR